MNKLQESLQDFVKIHTDDSYMDWLLSWDFTLPGKETIYDDDIWYRDDLTDEEKELCENLYEYEADITWRNNNYKLEYTYEDKDAYFPTIIMLLYAKGQWYELSTMWGQGSITIFKPIKDFKNWEYKDKIKYYYNMIKKEWYSLVR